MADQWITLLIQVPLVGVFIWYSLRVNDGQKESQKHFLEALDRRDVSFEQRTKALIETMNVNNRVILDMLAEMRTNCTEHDRFVREHVRGDDVREVTAYSSRADELGKAK